MVIQPKCRGFICLTAHPEGCYKNVLDMVNAAESNKKTGGDRPKNVLVVGCSSGYGLASRVVSAFTFGAKTIGVSFEKEGSEKRTATPGFYNNKAFDELAAEKGMPSMTINGDAFSNEIKDEVCNAAKKLFGGEKIDLLVYSLASPRRTDPISGITYQSVLKPIGNDYTNKSLDFHTGEVSEITISPATDDEVFNTIKVMGGEDWKLWVDKLLEEDLVSEGFKTVSYSYIGPELTHPIYKNGSIGKAKDNLLAYVKIIEDSILELGGRAYVSVNKGLVTQASAAIPVVPLYISLLYKIMKEQGTHEGCFMQMERLFTDRLYGGKDEICDNEGKIRMDDLEMSDEVQNEIGKYWDKITTENIDELTDIKGYREDFYSLFGFGRDDVDYDKDVTDF